MVSVLITASTFFPPSTDNFQDQMKRELAYREEMVQQLQIVSLPSLLEMLQTVALCFLNAFLKLFIREPCRCTITELILPYT